MEVTSSPIASLKFADYNPRILSAHDFNALKRSLHEFGVVEPIVVNLYPGRENIIIGGHQRVRAAQALNLEKIPCYFVSLPLEKEKLLNLALNRISGEWDEEKLSEVIYNLKEADANFLLSGFTDEELSNLLTHGMLNVPNDVDPDEIPEVPKEAVSKRGEIYQLGPHRLMCGNSTEKEDVERLMNGEKADIIFTSPPYNLGISTQLRGNTIVGKRGNCYEKYNDRKTEGEYKDFLQNFIDIWLEYSKYIILNIQSLAGNRTSLWQFINDNKDYFCDVAIWNKSMGAPQLARQVMNSCFEFIFFFSKNNPSRAIQTGNFRGTVNNVFDVSPQRRNDFSDIHGATFPVELPIKIISNFTQIGMIVSDPFSGTGSTLIACEKLNRRCRMMEIDPIYCDVIRNRYAAFVGKSEYATQKEGELINASH